MSNIFNKHTVFFTTLLIAFLLNTLTYAQKDTELSRADRKTYQEAVKLLSNGNTEEALKLLETLHKDYPNNLDILQQLTFTFFYESNDLIKTYQYGTQLLTVAKNILNSNADNKLKNNALALVTKTEPIVSLAKNNITQKSSNYPEKEQTNPAKQNQSTATSPSEQSKKTTKNKTNQNDTLPVLTKENRSDKDSTLISPSSISQNIYNNFVDLNRIKTASHKIPENEIKKENLSHFLNDYYRLQNTYDNYLNAYFKKIYQAEKELNKEIHRYNYLQYKKDSALKRLSLLKRRNGLIQNEIYTLKTFLKKREICKIDSLKLAENILSKSYIYKTPKAFELNNLTTILTSKLVNLKEFNKPEIESVLALPPQTENDSSNFFLIKAKESILNQDSTYITQKETPGNIFLLTPSAIIDIQTKSPISYSKIGINPAQKNTIKNFINAQNKANSTNLSFQNSIKEVQEEINSLNAEMFKNIQEIYQLVEIDYDSLIDSSFNNYYKCLKQYIDQTKAFKNYETLCIIEPLDKNKEILSQLDSIKYLLLENIENKLDRAEFSYYKLETKLFLINDLTLLKVTKKKYAFKPELSKGKIIQSSIIENQNNNFAGLSMAFEINYLFQKEPIKQDTLLDNESHKNFTGEN